MDDRVAYIAVGICVAILLSVILAVIRPWWNRWRVRRAIEYRAVAMALEARWPGFSGCLCAPTDDPRRAYGWPCVAKNHRNEAARKAAMREEFRKLRAK